MSNVVASDEAALAEQGGDAASAIQAVMENMTGLQKAALFLMSLGEEHAASIVQHLSPKEVHMLGEHISQINHVTQLEIAGVLDNFLEAITDQSSLSIGAGDYLRNTLTKALGDDKANSILSRLDMGQSKGLENLKWMDARAIADIIINEPAQIIAIVLSYIEPDQAGEVLALLPDDKRADVIYRIANLETVNPVALKELDKIISSQIDADGTVKLSNVGGLQVAADILNSTDTTVESEVIDQLAQLDQNMTTSIQDLMFVFDNLISLDNRGMQTLLRDVSSDLLVLALKGASTELQDKIFENMSKRAADLLKDDLETKGPVRITEVEQAQKDILKVAQQLAEEGRIALGGGGDDFV